MTIYFFKKIHKKFENFPNQKKKKKLNTIFIENCLKITNFAFILRSKVKKSKKTQENRKKNGFLVFSSNFLPLIAKIMPNSCSWDNFK